MKQPAKQNAIVKQVLAEINGMKYPDGKLPTEAELCQQFQASRQTVRKALAQLELQEIIVRRQGSGTYVNQRIRTQPKTGQIAVICTYISEYIFPSILRGIEGVTTGQGYRLLINSTNNSVASERLILSGLLENPVDGIIVEGTKTALPNPNREFYHRLAGRGIPIVFINSYYPDVTGDNVIHIVTDDYAGGYRAAAEMIRAGHRHICGIFKSDDMQGLLRYSGYMDALIQLGGEVRDNNVIWFSTETKSLLLQKIETFLADIDKDCTGVVCYNDQIAAPVIRFLESAKAYPVTIVSSFDQCLQLVSDSIIVSSYSHPKEKMGEEAARKLFNLIAGEPEKSLVFTWCEPE